jgi:hypothetical protein
MLTGKYPSKTISLYNRVREGIDMANMNSTLLQLIQSAEVAKNIQAEAERKALIAEQQRRAMDRARSFA